MMSPTTFFQSLNFDMVSDHFPTPSILYNTYRFPGSTPRPILAVHNGLGQNTASDSNSRVPHPARKVNAWWLR